MQEEYYIASPGKERSKFAIVCRRDRGLPTQRTTVVKSAAINAINNLYLEGRLPREQAKAALALEMEALRAPLRGAKSTLPASNEAILEAYWHAKYRRRDLKCKRSASNRLRRAVAALGNLSLLSATQDEIEDALAAFAERKKSDLGRESAKHQRDAASALTQILKYIGRPMFLAKRRSPVTQVRHLTLPEFRAVIEHIADPIQRLLFWAAIGTGARCGQLFTMKKWADGAAIRIETQLSKELTVVETKNRTIRNAAILPEAANWVAEWIAFPDKEHYRN